ncbi:Nuclear transport factor 2 family protein [Gossypium australe]|uniref:Nuclear transport factor 2 family protein n=1 Tax=Gossypium australe TaxID=47621 RepID=A0A5B6U8C0_9ROSI|nr:Nuclear transport factor 2 family protein [Gossypium australe]
MAISHVPYYLSKLPSPLFNCRLAAKKISEFSMENPQHPEGKEACESNPTNVKRVSDDIMPHLLNLYGSRATPHDFEIYAADASFEDPLMCAHGVKQIKSSFYSLSKVFSESRIVEYSITEKEISAGKHEVLVDNKQQYKFLGRHIDMISLIRLYVKDGKVVRHEDWWDKKPLRNRETVKLPCLGRMIELTRRGSMFITHALMGFGKDPPTG